MTLEVCGLSDAPCASAPIGPQAHQSLRVLVMSVVLVPLYVLVRC